MGRRVGRRGYGEDGIYFDHTGDCRDAAHHKGCGGRWRGVVSLGFAPGGRRIRKKVSGKTRTEVKDKLRALHSDLNAGVRPSHSYTVEMAVADWLESGLPGRTAKTVEVNRDSLGPVLARIGNVRLTDLTAQDVRSALNAMAATHATRTVQKAHNCLTRAIRHAEAQDLVRRNVSALVDTPRGQQGRPSQSLTLDQATALLDAASKSRLHAYIALCLLTGIRSEEARALTWDHVDLDAGTVSVWRSVRAHGDTKTQRSRRTLKLPRVVIEVLRKHRERQAEERDEAGELWQDNGLVLATSVGTPFESHNLRRDFRKVTKAAGIGERWVPKELRTSFVSLMSHSGVPVEEIARLAGHSSSRTTETIYRRELRPVITTGAEVMDQIFRS
ncbi:MAG: site-specific integrase [Streptosporangiaceae bacterium]